MEEKEKNVQKEMVMFGFNPEGELVIIQESDSGFNRQKVVLNEQEADMLRRFLNIMKGGDK